MCFEMCWPPSPAFLVEEDRLLVAVHHRDELGLELLRLEVLGLQLALDPLYLFC